MNRRSRQVALAGEVEPPEAGPDTHSDIHSVASAPDAVDVEEVLAGLADNPAALELIDQLSRDLVRARQAAADLTIALESNREIGAATGILMAQRQISQAEAFDVLRAASQTRHVKIRDLAREVVQTGVLHFPPSKAASKARVEPE